MFNAVVSGLGHYLPQRILTNHDLEKMVDTSDEWIRTRTGISERRIADEGVFTAQLATEAAREAVADAGLTPEQIDLILVASVTPDMITPSVSCIVQKEIGAVNAAAMDLNAACTGFIYALSVANSMIQTGTYQHVLIIGADCLSKVTDWKDRNTCVLFGDGAGAAVISRGEEGYGVEGVYLGADGTGGDALTLPFARVREEDIQVRPSGRANTIWMDGSEVFKFAVRAMADASHVVLERAKVTLSQVALLIPHQANMRIVDGAAKRLKMDREKIFTNVHKYGNMSTASIPVALYEAVRTGRVQRGDYVVLVGFGGGLTYGSVLLRWQ